MKKGKHAKNKFKIIEAYLVLIFIATLFMFIGYAQTSGVLSITGKLEIKSQEGVFITNISKTGEMESESKINFFIGTMFESQTILEPNNLATQIYEVELFNNSNKQYVFIDTLTDATDGTLYDNENIEFYTTEIEKYSTIIEPMQSLKFKITFKYKEGADLSKNILNSKLNFRFKEMPKLILSNNEEVYELNDIYPDYQPQRYEFTVENYIEETVNNIPMIYSFDINIDKPLSAKIYDEYNNEVTNDISLLGDSQTKETKKYFLEIVWDNSNEEENLKYDSSKYENKQFHCDVKLTAKPEETKYLEFSMIKGFEVNINSGKYKDRYEIQYTDITNSNYPLEIPINETLEITFIKEIPPEVQVTGVESYTYNKPTLILNNATSDVEIINTTGELLAYEYEGDFTFTGNNYINTEVVLFSKANIDRDFRIYFEITEDD